MPRRSVAARHRHRLLMRYVARELFPIILESLPGDVPYDAAA